ncbi:MAG: hypothetical protein ABJ084_14015 [Halioglobus sp.]
MTAARGLLILSLTLPAAITVYAAKPLSIQFLENKTGEDGAAYTTYQLKCSNGKKYVLTSRDNKARWCIGEQNSDGCETQQIAAAKTACASNQSEVTQPDPSASQ